MDTMNTLIEALREWAASDLPARAAQFLLWTVVILILAWLAGKGISRTVTDNKVKYRARKSIRLISYILILLLVIVSFTGKLQYFSIAIGLISAGIAFALQEVILSFAGWIAIFSAHIYRTGDRIEMGGVRGDVIDIGITKTTLMEIGQWVQSDNYSGRIVQVSNGAVFKGPVHNYSTDFPFVWDEITLPVKYGSDLKYTYQTILEIAQSLLNEYAEYAKDHWEQMVSKYLIENANVEPTLSFSLTDNWVEFNLRYVVDYKKRRSTKYQLFARINDAIEASGGKIQISSESIEIIRMPELDINVENPDQDRKV